MIVWTFMIGLILLIRIAVGDLSLQRNKKIFLISSAVIIIFIVGSRNATLNIGSDLNNYYRLYKDAIQMSWSDYFALYDEIEFGYLFLNKIFAAIIPWQQFILYLIATITTTIVFKYIYYNVEDVFLAVLIFLSLGIFGFFLTGFRQALAISICVLSFKFVSKRKFLPFIAIVLIASTIHRTAIVFLPVYFLANIKFTTIKNLVFIGFLMVAFVFRQVLLNFGNQIFDTNYVEVGGVSSVGGIINLLIYITALILTYVFLNNFKDKEDNGKLNILFHTSILGLFFYLLRFETLVMERISFYFLIYMILLIPVIFYKFKKTNIRNWAYLVLSFILIVLYLWRFQFISYNFFF